MTAIQKTNGWLNLIRDSGSGAQNPLIKYVALGTSTTTPLISDTKLGAETFRKAVTSYVNGATGELIVNMYLAPTDNVGANIEEVGFYAGGSATSAQDSGVLIARGLWAHNPKTNLESIVFALDGVVS